MIFIIVAALVYLFSLFFSNRLAYLLRWFYVFACIGFLIYGYFRKNWSVMWIVGFSLLVMILLKLIMNGTKSLRQRRKDRAFERQALEKAARRRGSFKEKQGYSGQVRPTENAPAPKPAAKEEIKEAVPETAPLKEQTAPVEIDDVPRDPLAEIEAVKAELEEAMHSGAQES